MAIDRRSFLQLGLAACVVGPTRLFASGAGDPRLLSCCADRRGRHYAVLVDAAGQVIHRLALPGRGHGIELHPNRRCAAIFARRPGDFLYVVDLETGQTTHRLTSPADRHYYGHGVFDPTGRLLYVTENAYASGDGRIGIYDVADDYRRIGELPSHGIGPHELKLLGDGRTLVIANGGIRTHPDTPRAKLNLADMDPNLAYVDTADGRLLGAYRPPAQWHQLSIRHIDVGIEDRVAVAMQFEGPREARPPLVALHQGEDHLPLLETPARLLEQMRNYCGSVRFDRSGRHFAVSSPRGGWVSFWDGASGRLLDQLARRDACGLAPTDRADGFWISDGNGAMLAYPTGTHWELAGFRWDNHLTLA